MIETTRHRDYFNPREYDDLSITIIGAGATGSRVFEALVNLGLTNISVYDFDNVEEHNLANQIYMSHHTGDLKVKGLSDWQYDKNGGEVKNSNFYDKKVEGNMKNEMGNVVFLLTDTMASRREIWKHSLWLNPNVKIVYETRMALTHGDIYRFNPAVAFENRKWNDSLIDDDQAETSACGTALSIHTTASIIANLAVNNMVHWLKGEPVAHHTGIYLHPLTITEEEWKNESQSVA